MWTGKSLVYIRTENPPTPHTDSEVWGSEIGLRGMGLRGMDSEAWGSEVWGLRHGGLRDMADSDTWRWGRPGPYTRSTRVCRGETTLGGSRPGRSREVLVHGTGPSP